MAAAVLELLLSNLVVAAVLAVIALAAGRWGKRPALTHALWLLVLLKLVTPPVIDLPVRLLPPAPEARETVALRSPGSVDAPGAVADGSASAPAPGQTFELTPASPVSPPPSAVGPPRKLEDFRPRLDPAKAAKPVEKPAATPAPQAMPKPAAEIPQFALDPPPQAQQLAIDVQRSPAASGLEYPVPGPQSALPVGGSEDRLPANPEARHAALGTPYSVLGTPHSFPFPWAGVALAVWFGGGLAWLALVALRVRRFARVLRLADDAPAWFAREVAATAEALGLARSPRVKLIPGAVAPMVWSLGRAAVYFPAELLRRLSATQRASLVAHELAHLRRGDHWVRWLELAVVAAYWWCPLAWFARRELQRAEEECCDAWVLASLPAAGRTYASALLDTLDFLAESPLAPALASGMGTATTVKRRLLLILDGKTPNRLPRVGRVFVFLLAVLLLPVAPKLARLAAGPPAPDAQVADAVRLPETATPFGTQYSVLSTQQPGAQQPAANPRGEPLLYESQPADIRPKGLNWRSVSVSPDGKTIATAHGSRPTKGELWLWDRESGKVKQTIAEPQGVRSVAYSPDGKLIVTGNFDGVVRFYDADTGTLQAIGTGHSGEGVNSVCFFKEGKLLVSAGLDKTVRVWDVAAIAAKRKPGETVKTEASAVFEGHAQGVLSVAGSADGLTIVSGSFDNTARMWDVPDPLPKPGEKPELVKKERVTLRGHNRAVEAVAIDPEGNLIATGSWDAQLIVWDRDGKRAEFSGAFQSGVMAVAFSRDGKFLAAGAGDAANPDRVGEIRVWDVAAKKEIAYRADYPEAVLGVGFTPDNKTVVSIGSDQALHLWPVADPQARQTFNPPGQVFTAQPLLALAVSADGRFMAFSGDSKSVFVWDRRDGKLVAELTGHADVVTGLAFSPDGKTLATASHDKTVRLWDTTTWKERHTLTGHTGWVLGVAFSPDGKTLATGSYDKTVRIWSAQTSEPPAVLKDHTAGIRAVAFSTDGKFLVSAGGDRIIRVWDRENKVVFLLKGHKAAIRALAVSPDGKLLASASEDRTVKLWELATGKELSTLGGLPDMATAVRFSPRGQTLAVTTFNGALVVWDPVTGRKRQTLFGHNDTVTGAAFVDDGKHILTVSQDRRIRQWSAVQPSGVGAAQTLVVNPKLVTAVGVSPNGLVAVLGGADGSLTLWDLKTGATRPFLADAHPGGVAQIAVTDGLPFASVGKDGTLLVSTLTSEGPLPIWKGKGRHACFSPDGKTLAVADGRNVVLYEAQAGKEIRKLEAGHDGPVACVAFSPDGKRLISAGEDVKIRLWDPATGEKKQATNQPLTGYASIPCLVFNPDGTKLAVVVNSPDSPPPDDMTGRFRQLRTAFVLNVPPNENDAWNVDINQFLQHPFEYELTGAAWAGRGLVTTSTEGLVRVWDPDGRRVVQTFRAHDAAILAAAIAPESGAFVTTGEDMAVRRWRLPGVGPTPGIARLAPPGQGRVWAADYSPDGKYFVSAGGGDKMFRVYSTVPAAIPVEADKYPAVMGLAFSPNGKFLVTGHDRGVLVVREAATGKPIRTLEGHTKRISSVAFAEGGAALVTVGGNWADGKEPGEAIVWDFPAGTIRHRLEAPSLQWMVAVHPDGKTAAIAASDGKVWVWDLATGKLVTTLGKGQVGQKVVAFSPDGSRIAAGGYDLTIRIYDVGSGKELRAIPTGQLLPTRVLFSPDGTELVVSAWKGAGQADRPPSLTAYSLDDLSIPPRQFPTHPASVMNLAFLPDGKTLISSGGEANGVGSLRVYDFATGKPLGQLAGHRHWGQNLAVSPDGKRVASTSWATGASGELRLWNASGFRPIATVAMPNEKDYVSCGAISPDGKLLVLGGWGKALAAFDMTDPARPKLKKELGGHTGGLRSVAFSDDGRRFVTSDEAGFVRVWDAATLSPVSNFKASEQGVYRAKFTPDSKNVVTVTGNWQQRTRGEIRVWDPQTGKEAGRFPDQNREVWDVVFLDGGKVMVTVQALDRQPSPGEATLKVWDFDTRTEKRAISPIDVPRSAAVSPDGKLLAVGSSNGPVKVFDTTTWQEVLAVTELKDVSFRVAFSPDGKTLIVASGDNAAVLIGIPENR